MKQKEIFELFIRCLGLLLVIYGLYPIYLLLIWLIPGVSSPHAFPLLLYLGIPCLIIGLYFLRGAKWLICFVYPDKEQEKKDL